jgi:hypothetical protein
MTFVGKILVVLILVMSLVFMTIAGMVFATHTNWRDHIQTVLMPRITGLEQQLTDLETKRTQLEEELANARADLERRNSQLETALADAVAERNELDSKLATETQRAKEAVAAMDATQASLAAAREQIATLNTAIDAARLARDEALTSSREDEDLLAQSKAQLDLLGKRNRELAAQIAKYEVVMQENNLHIESVDYKVEGVVLDSRDNGMIEVSIGFDDGLEVDHLLEVYRYGVDAETSVYLGRARVVRVEADRAVAQVIPETRKGNIVRDDRVATRLR